NNIRMEALIIPDFSDRKLSLFRRSKTAQIHDFDFTLDLGRSFVEFDETPLVGLDHDRPGTRDIRLQQCFDIVEDPLAIHPGPFLGKDLDAEPIAASPGYFRPYQFRGYGVERRDVPVTVLSLVLEHEVSLPRPRRGLRVGLMTA